MARAIRLDYQGPQPSDTATVDARAEKPVRMASDEDVRNAIKRITRDHEELIKALAK